MAERLGPTLDAVGLRVVSRVRFPAWGRPAKDGASLFVIVQADAKATDEWAGAQFRVELEKAPAGKPSSGLTGRALFFQLLDTDELSSLLDHQNRVIRSLPRPPETHVAVYPAGEVRDMYQSYFAPQAGFDAVRSWLRCPTTADADTWAQVLTPMLPKMVERADRLLDRATLHLGKGSLLGA